MKIPLYLLAAIACTAGMVEPALAQAPVVPTSKTVVVRAYDSPTNKIYISYGGGKTETAIAAGPYGKKDQQRDTEQLQQIVDRLYAEGYRMVGSATGGVSDQRNVTYIFRRD